MLVAYRSKISNIPCDCSTVLVAKAADDWGLLGLLLRRSAIPVIAWWLESHILPLSSNERIAASLIGLASRHGHPTSTATMVHQLQVLGATLRVGTGCHWDCYSRCCVLIETHSGSCIGRRLPSHVREVRLASSYITIMCVAACHVGRDPAS